MRSRLAIAGQIKQQCVHRRGLFPSNLLLFRAIRASVNRWVPSAAFALTVCFLALWLSSPAGAGAQEAGRPASAVAVLPWLLDAGQTPSEQSTNLVRATAEGLERRGISPIDPSLARMRLLSYARFPMPVLPGDREELLKRAKQAWFAVAAVPATRTRPNREAEEARSAIKAAVDFAAERLETFNRDEKVAQAILDVCLLAPRVSIAEGVGEQLAAIEALQCLKMVPGRTPSETSHPPEVFAVLEQVERLAEASPNVLLTVASDKATEHCEIFINGRRVGRTPFSDRLMSGAYKVQVECASQTAGTGLVHDVTLANKGARTINVDGFEPLLRAEGRGVYLADSVDSSSAHTGEALQSLAHRLSADQIVLVRPQGDDKKALLVVDSELGLLPCEEHAQDNDSDVDQALARLFACSASAVSAMDAQKPVASIEKARPTRWELHRPTGARAFGFALFALGGVSLAAGWAVQEATDINRSESVLHTSQALALGGGLALAVSEPLWLPVGQRHAPWWAWAGMAAGVFPAGVAIWQWATNGRMTTDDDGYRARFDTRSQIATNLGSAIPLLLLPANHYLARAWWGRPVQQVSAGFRYQAEGFTVALHGVF